MCICLYSKAAYYLYLFLLCMIRCSCEKLAFASWGGVIPIMWSLYNYSKTYHLLFFCLVSLYILIGGRPAQIINQRYCCLCTWFVKWYNFPLLIFPLKTLFLNLNPSSCLHGILCFKAPFDSLFRAVLFKFPLTFLSSTRCTHYLQNRVWLYQNLSKVSRSNWTKAALDEVITLHVWYHFSRAV